MKYFACVHALAVALCASSADSQTFTTLLQFSGTGGTASGADPLGSLTLNGTTLYGMTHSGGANAVGNVFSLGINGANYQNLLSFTGTGGAASGEYPWGGLTITGTTVYGLTSQGGAHAAGNVFSVGTDGTNYQNLLSFTGSGGTAIGWVPFGSLTLSNTTLYGMTANGGANFAGNVFSVGTDGTHYQNLLTFAGAGYPWGQSPQGSLTLSNTTLYGMTENGGYGHGNIFSIRTDGSNYKSNIFFSGNGSPPDGSNPRGSLTLNGSGTTLYGMTLQGGANGHGNIFSAGTDVTTFQDLVSFTGTGGSAIGASPAGSLILSGTTLYGMTLAGGTYGDGNIFSVGIDGSGFRDFYNFTGGADGSNPQGDLTLSSGTLFGMTSQGGANGDGTVFALALSPTPEPGTLALAGTAAVAAIAYRWRRMRSRRKNRLSTCIELSLAIGLALSANSAKSQTLTTLVEFTGTGGTASGAGPYGSLTPSGTTLYGMTNSGGTNGDGNIFSVGLNGTNYQNLLSFSGTGGAASGLSPRGSLALSGTTLFGMTSQGGASGQGNVFSVGTGGTNYQNLFSFTGSPGGQVPYGGLMLSGTALYGMTSRGGNNGDGNVFSGGTGGTTYQNLVSFTGTSGAESGEFPTGSLTLSGTTLYGMTTFGGNSGDGNIFSAGTGGANYHNLVSFTGIGGAASGADPQGSLTLNGTTLYGMTNAGGAHGDGNVFSVSVSGTNYQNLLSFSGTGGAASGSGPDGSLILSGTTLYGMTSFGGADGWGNIFSVGIDGTGYQNLYTFTGGSDGGIPHGDLTLSGGTLFGMTAGGGANGDGTVFALTLAPTPEPGTLALAGTAAVAAVAYRWRRRRSRRPQQPGLR